MRNISFHKKQSFKTRQYSTFIIFYRQVRVSLQDVTARQKGPRVNEDGSVSDLALTHGSIQKGIPMNGLFQ